MTLPGISAQGSGLAPAPGVGTPGAPVAGAQVTATGASAAKVAGVVVAGAKPAAAALLQVRGLRVRYGAIEAVKGVDIALHRGRVLALLGSNGAGKTTTILALMGLVRVSGGEVLLDGSPLHRLPPEDIARRGMALSPEGRRVFANLTVEENLVLGGAAHVARPERDRRRDAQFARFPILGERRRQKAGLLSGGEQQMLAIARALMSAPRILLLDEPSLGLAPKLVAAVFDLIAGLRRDGLTVLLVEQNVAQSLAVADDAVVLASGRVVAAGPAQELAQTDAVRRAYFAG